MKIMTGKKRLKWPEVKKKRIQLNAPQTLGPKVGESLSEIDEIDNLRTLSVLVKAILQASCHTL